MDIQEITSEVTRLINHSIAGAEVENPKVDFKRRWYDLKSEKGRNEFAKDTSAIANTIGPKGYIIIGYDDKEKQLTNARFADSNLSDTSELNGIVNKHITEPFDFTYFEIIIRGSNIGVIHIPPSLNKPHFINNYQTFDREGKLKKEESQRVFVRKNTATYPASKYDIDLMYYDRKNIIPEFDIYASITISKLDLSNVRGAIVGKGESVNFIRGKVGITFENLGRRAISIDTFFLNISLFEDASKSQKLSFELRDQRPYINGTVLKVQDILFKDFELQSFDFSGDAHDYVQRVLNDFLVNKRNLIVQDFRIRTTDNRELYPKLNLI